MKNTYARLSAILLRENVDRKAHWGMEDRCPIKAQISIRAGTSICRRNLQNQRTVPLRFTAPVVISFWEIKVILPAVEYLDSTVLD